jgi:hypothetical protein
LLSFCSCFLTSKNPLSSLKEAQVDNDLLGKWQFVDNINEKNEKISYLLVLKAKENQMLFIMLDEDYEYSESYQGFITDTDGKKIINLKSLQIEKGQLSENKDDSYIFLYYTIKNNIVTFSMFNEKIFIDAVKNKELKGEITKYNNRSETVILTDEGENILKYINSRNIDDIIEKDIQLIFKRVS